MCDRNQGSQNEMDEGKRKYQEQLQRCKRLMEETAAVETKPKANQCEYANAAPCGTNRGNQMEIDDTNRRYQEQLQRCKNILGETTAVETKPIANPCEYANAAPCGTNRGNQMEIDDTNRRLQEQLQRCKNILGGTVAVESKAQQQLENIGRLIDESEAQQQVETIARRVQRSQVQPSQPCLSPIRQCPGARTGFRPELPTGPRETSGTARRQWNQTATPDFMTFDESGILEEQWGTGAELPQPTPESLCRGVRWPAEFPYGETSGRLIAPWAHEEAIEEYDPYYQDPRARSLPQPQREAPCLPCSASKADMHRRSPPTTARSPSPRMQSPVRPEQRPRSPSPPPPGPPCPQVSSPPRARSPPPRTPSPPRPATPCEQGQQPRSPSPPRSPRSQIQYMRTLFGVEEEEPSCPQVSSQPGSPRARSPPPRTPSPPPRTPSPPPRTPSPPPKTPSPPRPALLTATTTEEYFENIRRFYGVGEEQEPEYEPQSPPPAWDWSQARDTQNPAHKYLYKPYRVPTFNRTLSSVEEANPVDELGSGMDDYCKRAGIQPVPRHFEPPFRPPGRYTHWKNGRVSPWKPLQNIHKYDIEDPVEEDDVMEYLKSDHYDEYRWRLKAQQRQELEEEEDESSTASSPCTSPTSAQRPRSPARQRTSPPGTQCAQDQVQQVGAETVDVIRQARDRLNRIFRENYGEGFEEYISDCNP